MAEGGVPCSYSCVICGQDGLSDHEMRSHILLEHIESSVCCPFCDLQGDSIEDVEDHLYSEHQDVLSPSKKLNGGADITNIQDIHVKRGKGVSSQKSSSKKGKKAPYVNLEYFNKSLVDMTCDGSSRGYEIPVLHMGSSSKGETENTITGLADSTSDSADKNVFVNAETGEKMYRLPVTHMFSNRSESSPGKMSSLASKRARLSLDVSPCSKSSPSKSSGETSSSTSSGSEFHCPLCKFKTSSEAEIQRHVNISHLDVLSPAKPTSGSSGMPVDSATAFSQVENGTSLDNEQYMEIIPEGEPMPSTSHMVYECPICSMHLDSSLSLELHVNSKHSDVLSPDVPASGSDSVLAEATTTSPMEDDNLCPVCGLRISDPVSMTSHVETHFLPERTPGEVAMEERDIHMASEMQASERASQMSVDAAMAADLVNRERMDELLAKDLAEKEERTQLDEQKEFERLQAKYGMDDKNSYKKQYELSLERAVCKGQITMTEFYNHKSSLVNTGVNGIDDGHSCTKGILSQLERFYEHLPAAVSRMWLCSEADHFAASHGDKGWGCGYRNFQMLLSSLSNHQPYHKVLFNGRPMIPSIPKIQRLIEAAWQKGFDTQGADQLGGKLVNTSKWIGATEITATLLSLKVRCELLDFHQPTGPGGTHPRMLDWVRDYFIRTTGHRPPLYLQHHGHSRTIIGVEELKDGNLRLLLFDPSCSKRQMEQFIDGVTGGQLRTLRRAAQSLKAKQYQIVAVTGILDEQEYENRKVIRSQRIP